VRIGVVSPYSLTVPGGVQAQVLGLGRALRAAGHHARVLGPCDGPPPDSGVTPLGVSIPTAANGSVAPLAPDPAAQLRTIRALRDEGFDVLHLHEPLAPGPNITALLVHSAPIVATFHAAGTSAAYSWLGPAVRFLARRIDRRCAVSADAKAMAEKALGGEYTMLFNGIEVDRFAKATPWPAEQRTIFFCGRHEPRKGLAVLLEAMQSLPADVQLWIGSFGPDTAALRQQYEGDTRLHWLGRLSEEEKASRLRGAHVFAAPSLGGESFGVVLLEAMAARAPIVASDLPGYRNVARPDIEGLLVPPGDPAALAAALARVLDDGLLASDLSAAGEQRADEFSMDRLAECYVEIYKDVVAAARRR
jgi:phosphatidylinositol alpha-mannosyltransferase